MLSVSDTYVVSCKDRTVLCRLKLLKQAIAQSSPIDQCGSTVMTWSSIKLTTANASWWEDLPSFCQSFVNTTAAHQPNGGTKWYMRPKRGLKEEEAVLFNLLRNFPFRRRLHNFVPWVLAGRSGLIKWVYLLQHVLSLAL